MENVSEEWLGTVALRDWMDSIVELKQCESRLKRFGNQILLPEAGEKVQVYSLIGSMASAAGVELEEEVRSGRYPFKYSFIYKGIRFFQLSEDRLEGHVTEGTG